MTNATRSPLLSDDFLRGYAECALWSSPAGECGGADVGENLDDAHGVDDIAPETLAKMAEDCAAFRRDNAADLAAAEALGQGEDDTRAGHDFWLTRNRHGAGFWDRNLGQVGDRLTKAAHVYGECYLYAADVDGRGPRVYMG